MNPLKALVAWIGSSLCLALSLHAGQFTFSSPSQIVQPGGNAQFSATYSLSLGIRAVFRWQVSTNEGVDYLNITDGPGYAGATSLQLAVQGVTPAMNRYLYRATAQEINVQGANVGPVQYTVPAMLNVPQELGWDLGATDEGTVGFTSSPQNSGGDHVFKLVTRPTAVGAWRATLRVTSGSASLSLRRSSPVFDGSTQAATASSDRRLQGLVRPDAGIETWYVRVNGSAGAVWTLVCGEVFVQEMGAVGVDPSPVAQESSIGSEGYRFFRGTLPVGTAGWQLWLNNGVGAMSGAADPEIAVRRSRVPLVGLGGYDHKQRDHMLLVPPYTDSAAEGYYVAIRGEPGSRAHLESRRVPVADLDFGSSRNFSMPPSGYLVYRTAVPIEQIGWLTELRGLSSNVDIALRRGRVGSEWFNDALSEGLGTVGDSVTIVPPALSDGTYYITLYSSRGGEAGTILNRVPFSAEPDAVPFLGTSHNDEPTTPSDDANPQRVGWRYFQVGTADPTGIDAQLRLFGWELSLAGAPTGSSIAIRRTFLPGRWRYRNGFNSTPSESTAHHHASSENALMQVANHQADIWYIGVYSAVQPLGPFQLERRAILPPGLAFDAGVARVTNQPAATWRYFKVEVPETTLGWDLRLLDGVGDATRAVMYIRRDALPERLNDPWPSNPGRIGEWPSGYQRSGGLPDIYIYDRPGSYSWYSFRQGTGRHFEAGTYYVGIENWSATPISYTLDSRGIGSGMSLPVEDLDFAGGVTPVAGIAPREARYFRVKVPTNAPSWEVLLDVDEGEMHMELGAGSVPDNEGRRFNYLTPSPANRDETIIAKLGSERYVLMPSSSAGFIGAGDYYIAVTGDGMNPTNQVVGTGTSQGVLRSVGPLPVENLGEVGLVETRRRVDLVGGQMKAYRFQVAPGTASLEMRLENRTGLPRMSYSIGLGLPRHEGSPWSYYGGSNPTGVHVDVDVVTGIASLANPKPGTYTVMVQNLQRADGGDPSYNEVIPPASADLVVMANRPVSLSFDGGTGRVTNQPAGTWRYFKVEVPETTLGWDLRLLDGVGDATRAVMYIRRDALPERLNDPWPSNPGRIGEWPSGYQRSGGLPDIYIYDRPGSYSWYSFRQGTGRHFEAGTYYVGIENWSATPISYTLDSRGIGSGMSLPVEDLDFAGGVTPVAGIAPREARYFRVKVPTNAPSWEVLLDVDEGEMHMELGAGSVPDNEGRRFNYLTPSPANRDETIIAKLGSERYVLMPSSSAGFIGAGDYYIAVTGDGMNPTNQVVGTGTSQGVLRSVGPLPVENLGEVGLVETRRRVDLVGGQMKAYRFQVAPGTASLEMRLENRTGLPRMSYSIGLGLPRHEGSPWSYYGGSNPTGVHVDVDVVTGIASLANPKPGTYTVMVQNLQRADGGDPSYNEVIPPASADLVVMANRPVSLSFDGGTGRVTNQPAGTWRYFKVEVPETTLGWDLRLLDGVGDATRAVMYIRRDALPERLNDPWPSNPGRIGEWPSGYQRSGGLPDIYIYDRPGSYSWYSFRQGTGRHFEAGTYYVGIENWSATPISYTLDSRGIGSGMSLPVEDLDFAGGVTPVAGIAPREARYFRVKVPTNAPSWEVLLDVDEGEMHMELGAGSVPDNEGRRFNYLTPSPANRDETIIAKLGSERYVLMPSSSAGFIGAGDYYIAVTGDGMNPTNQVVGTGTSQGVLRSVGPLPVENLGEVGLVETRRRVDLVGGQMKAYRFQVAPGTASLEMRLENRTGLPRMSYSIGLGLPRHEGSPWSYYGGSNPTGVHVDVDVVTGIASLANPKPGTYTVMVQNLQRADGGDPSYNEVIPPASADLVFRSKGNVVLGFSDVVASGGLSNHDSRQMVDGEYTVYEVAVPPVATGAPVPSWKIHTDLRQGAVSLQIYKDPARPEGGIAVSGGDAIVVPPYLTAGETWYVRVKATGFTDYTIGSEQVKTEVPVWLMPDGLNQEFGDSGAELSGDRGVYLGNRQWHFYAIDVPEGNSGLLRTELQAISGNPDLYIREDGVPTLIHSAGGPSGSLYDRSLTASVTEYGNWVPSDRETRLRPGRWYLGVRAAGSSNARYRLLASTGVVKDMAIDGGGLELQSMADNDWRYYRFVVPWDAPRNWALTFRQQVGDVKLWIRDTVPPGQGRFNSGGSDIAAWDDDARNAGPYPSFDEPGTHVLTTPPLRPGQVYFAGFRSANSATFSISSVVTGGSVGLSEVIPFHGGQTAGVLAPGASASYRIEVPSEATRFKLFGTHSSLVTWSVEQGTVASVAGPVHWRSSGMDPVLNVSLSPRSWPWAPGYTYYLTVTNASGSPTPFALRSDGRNALTEDEDNDGLPDSWEVRHFGFSWRYDGNGDPDADGNRNSVEWVDGTNPSDAGSARYFLNVKSVHGSVERSVLLPKYDKGTRVTLTPVADTGYFFSRWSGSTNSAVPVLALDVAGDLSLNAEFLPQAVAIVGQPVGGQWYFGDTVTLEVLATGQPVLGYQWKRDGVDLVSGPNLAGVTGPALVINPFDSAYSGAYTVVVSNAFNSVTSAVAVLSPPLGRTNVWLGQVSRDWFIPENWSLNRVPGSLDVVRLSQGAVGVTTNSVFARLEINGGTVFGALRASSGTVVNWTSGTLESDGVLTVEAGATLNLSGGSGKSLMGSLTNAGTVVWEGAGDLYLNGPPSYRGGIVNLPGAVFEARNDQYLYRQTGTPVFQNGGIFRKAVGSGATRFSGVGFGNQGMVEVQSGTLELSGGGVAGGGFSVTEGAVLQMSGGTFQATLGTTFSGGGLKRISGGSYAANVLGVPGRWAVSGGDVTLNGSLGSLDLGGGTLHGTNGVVAGMNWTGGELASDGSLTVEAGATLNLSGGSGKSLMGSLTNAGTVVWEGAGDLYLNGPPSYRGGIVNLPGAVFEARNDQYLYRQTGTPVFQNGGIFRKAVGSGATRFSGVGFGNQGMVEVQSGTLELSGGGVAGGGFSVTEGAVLQMSGGTFQATLGTTFSGGGLKRISGGSYAANVLGVPGRWAVSGGDVTLNGSLGSLDLGGGTLHGTNGVVAGMNWTGGELASDGSLTVEAGATLNLSGGSGKSLMGSLTNAGTVVWEGAGDLYLNGPPSYRGGIVNLPGAVFEARNDQYLYRQTGTPVFQNGGIFRKAVGSGATRFSGVGFGNQGMVEVQSGTLELSGGGVAGGGFSVTEGAVLQMSGGTFQATLGTTFSGGGLKRISGGSYAANVLGVPGRWAVSGGDVTLNGSLGSLDLGGGTLHGTNGVVAGMNWTGGELASDGALTVEAGATLNLSGGSEKRLMGSLTNAGTVVWEGTGWLMLYGPPSYRGGIVNLPGAVFEARNDQSLYRQTGTPVFQNGGIFRKAVGSGATRFSGVGFGNQGMVEVQSGTLELSGGGVAGGGFSVTEGAVLQMSGGTFQATLGTTFSGGGLKRISGGSYAANVLGVPGRWAVSGGDVTLNGSLGSLDLGGGTLHGTNGVVAGMNWTGGELASDGALTVEAGATLNLSGGSEKRLMGSLTNAGTVVWEGTGWLMLYGPPSYRGGIVNLPGAVFEARNDQSLYRQTGTPVFQNGGTFRKTVGSGTTSFSGVGWVNAGAVEVLSGKVASGSFEMTGGSLAFGIASPTVFGRMSLSGTAQLAGGLRTILLNGYQPANEAAFDVMTFASRSGGFTDLTDLKAGLGRHFEPIFTASGVSLQVRPSLTLAAVLPQTLNEETTLNVMLKGANADLPGQTLVYRLVAGPVGMTVSGAGLLAWTPTEAQGPSTNSVAVAVSDGFTSVTNRVEVTVVEVNQAPVLSAVSAQAVNEKTALSLTLQATDADVPAQALRYRLVDGPTGMTVSGAGLLAWTPTEAQGPSTNQVLVSVTDGVLTATNAFTLVVLDSTPPPVPEFGGLPVFESGKLRFAIRGAGRVRVETSADLVVWTAVEVLTVESGVLKEWVQAVGAEAFLAYRLVRE